MISNRLSIFPAVDDGRLKEGHICGLTKPFQLLKIIIPVSRPAFNFNGL